VHKISVIPRGRALGYTLTLPEEDKFLMTREELNDELAMMLGGRVAEEIMVGDVTTGAANDIERATKVARQMVTEYGMSDDLGPLTLGQKTGEVFLGRDFSSHPDYSEQVAFEIDNEVRRLIDEAHDMALEILGENRENLDRWADVLIDKETVDKAQIEELFASVRKRAQRDPEKRSAGLAVSRTAVRQHKSQGPSGLRG
jgi:cell division protease FtsH